MKRLVLATQNKNKLKEVKEMLEPLGFEIITMTDVGLADVEIVEDGDTFEYNAIKKAKEISALCKLPVLADDSGLMVDALDGAPGVYSARYSGEHANYEKNNIKLLKALENVVDKDRTAQFVCVMAFIDQKNNVQHIARGEVAGFINKVLAGEGGFGYDPLFYVPEIAMTFAEAGKEVKNKLSHRAKALKKIQRVLEENL